MRGALLPGLDGVFGRVYGSPSLMARIAEIPMRIAQVSDVHFGSGSLGLPTATLDGVIERIRIDPDVVVLAGDLTAAGTSGSTRRLGAGWSGSSIRR